MVNFKFVCFIICVAFLVQTTTSAPPTKKPKTKEENLDGKLLHDDVNFDHNKTEGSWKEHQNLNITDPSADRLEAEIKIRGHENEKLEKDKQKLNITDPSVGELEKAIKIPGHEKDKISSGKLNITNPSTDDLEKTIRIAGHETDKKTDSPRLNISEPSLDEIEKLLQVKGHENDTATEPVVGIIKPNAASLDGELLHSNPKFAHVSHKPEKQNLTSIEPSNQLLEKMIAIENGSLNEVKINRTDILPSYEGFHGLLVHGDETYEHAHENDTHFADGTQKPADLDDFKTWLATQAKESKLDRFKRLDSEFEKMNKKMEDHDHFKKEEEEKEQNVTKGETEKEKRTAAANEKLKKAIKQLEEEERRRRKTDL